MAATEFEVTNVFQGDRRSLQRWVLSHTLRHSWPLFWLFFGALTNAALAAVVPVFLGRAFNAILAVPPDYGRLGQSALWIIFSQLLRSGLQLSRNFGAEVIGQRLERDVRAELYASLLGKSMTFHSLRPVGEVMARATNDVRELGLMLNPGVNLIVGSGMFVLMPLVFAPTIHPALVLAPAFYSLGYVWALWRLTHELGPIAQDARRKFGTLNAGLAEALEGIEIVKGAAREDEEGARFDHNAAAYRDAYVRQGAAEARSLTLLLLPITLTLGFGHALLLFRAGALNAGGVVTYNSLLWLLGFPSFVSIYAYSQMTLGMASARRILELITAETELDHNPAGRAAPIQGAIRFEDVAFAYADADGTPVLADISFSVAPGQTVAIVGQTGAGKTTLVRLVSRIYDVSAGSVQVDGVDVRDWNLAVLRQQISIIEQDLFLFSRTVAENIAFGRPGATQAEIEAAARAAQAHDFILAFKDGYQTVVGERGVTLSGGQRQRLALARAFLTNPRILILDDSTSAIDSATEDQIQKAIFRAAEGRTTLLITHRLSQIRWADQIVVLRQGRLAAVGSHDELLAASPAYQAIFARQERRKALAGD
ncbi:MAG: ABC transporter ATP-binding protein [Anaerolineales bacterium]|nr:ABC transporter ATP-binding protein [Anaerolineales bacterium]